LMSMVDRCAPTGCTSSMAMQGIAMRHMYL
jgi:hypothetical protein